MLLAHFRRIFPLFFQWMHADDDDTLILVSIFIYIYGSFKTSPDYDFEVWRKLFKVYHDLDYFD